MKSWPESIQQAAQRLVGWGCVCWCLLIVAGCTTPRPPPAHPAAFWSGRLALQLQSLPPQHWSTSFELQGSSSQGEMLIFSPIGTTLARLSWAPGSAQLEQGADKIESTNLQSLSQRLTGTNLPIAALFDWLAGQATAVPGWQVDLTAYPQGRLTAQRLEPAPEAVVRIVLDR